MSESFGTLIDAGGLNVARIASIRSALKKQWPFKDGEMFFYTIGNGEARMLAISGGYSDDEPMRVFAERLAKAVWSANVEYCKVRISIMDHREFFTFDVRDYFRLMGTTFDSFFV